MTHPTIINDQPQIGGWTDDEVSTLMSWYANNPSKRLNLRALAVQLNRHHTTVCRKARSLGLTNLNRTLGGPKRKTKHPTVADARRAIGEATKSGNVPMGTLAVHLA